MKLEKIDNFKVNSLGESLDGMQLAYIPNNDIVPVIAVTVYNPAYTLLDIDIAVSEIGIFAWFIVCVIRSLVFFIFKNKMDESKKKIIKSRIKWSFLVFLCISLICYILYGFVMFEYVFPKPSVYTHIVAVSLSVIFFVYFLDCCSTLSKYTKKIKEAEGEQKTTLICKRHIFIALSVILAFLLIKAIIVWCIFAFNMNHNYLI